MTASSAPDLSHDHPGVDPSEHELAVTIETVEPPITVAVSKVGGGTVGATYSGYWHYVAVSQDGEVLSHGSDLHTARPKNHLDAAELVAALIHEFGGVYS